MPIDTDIQSFTEYNANITDMNNKLNAFWGLVGQTPTSSDTNKVVIERSNIWKYEGEERYNGLFQLFGNISGVLSLSINSSSGRTAVLATIIGNTFVTDFGLNIVTGVIYTVFLKQDVVGGHSFRWPYGASVLNSVKTGANDITVVQLMKLPNDLFFIKCEAFTEAALNGFVIKEFQLPEITYPDGGQTPNIFTWTKASAITHGGEVTGLYSDWEIAEDSLYTTLLFSSYGNMIDLTSIQVTLNHVGTVHMRTRYGGVIDENTIFSPWDEAVVDLIVGNIFSFEDDFTIIDASAWEQIGLSSVVASGNKMVITALANTWNLTATNCVKYKKTIPNNFELNCTLDWAGGSNNLSETWLFLKDYLNSNVVGILDGKATYAPCYHTYISAAFITGNYDAPNSGSMTIKIVVTDLRMDIYRNSVLILSGYIFGPILELGFANTRYTTYAGVVASIGAFSIQETTQSTFYSGTVLTFETLDTDLWEVVGLASANIQNNMAVLSANTYTWNNPKTSCLKYLGTIPTNFDISAIVNFTASGSSLSENYLFVATATSFYGIGFYDGSSISSPKKASSFNGSLVDTGQAVTVGGHKLTLRKTGTLIVGLIDDVEIVTGTITDSIQFLGLSQTRYESFQQNVFNISRVHIK